MAKSKNFFGPRRGSTKSLTFSTMPIGGKRVQVTKERVAQISDPRTTRQIEQRMKLHFLSKMAQQFPVLKGLFPNSSRGFNPFISENLKSGASNFIGYPHDYNSLAVMDLKISDGPFVNPFPYYYYFNDNKKWWLRIDVPSEDNGDSDPWSTFLSFVINDHTYLKLGDTLIWYFLRPYQSDLRLVIYTMPLTETPPSFIDNDFGRDVLRFEYDGDIFTQLLLQTEKDDEGNFHYSYVCPEPLISFGLAVKHNNNVSSCRPLLRDDIAEQLEDRGFIMSFDKAVSLYYPDKTSDKYLNSGNNGVNIVGGKG